MIEDVEFLNERVEQGAEKALIKEKLIYGKKENLANAINTVRAKDKRVVCVGISNSILNWLVSCSNCIYNNLHITMILKTKM